MHWLKLSNARYEELFTLVLAELRRSGFEESIASGIVLTGGAAKVEGVIELAEYVFQMPVRLGYAAICEWFNRSNGQSYLCNRCWIVLYGYQQQLSE